MAKKQTKKATSKKPQAKANAKPARRPAAANQPAAAKRARATPAAPATASHQPAANAASRLPPPGTVIQKLDRHGAVRCECAVEEAGIRYNGNLYRSLSGAAMAAAKDLGLHNKTQNGFTFWGLTKPTRTLDDPEAALKKACARFQGLATAVTNGVTDANRAKIRAALQQHGQVVESLLGQVA